MELPAGIDQARKELLAVVPDAWAFYLHGSLARGNARPDSDADIAVLLPPGQQIPDRLGLASRLAAALGREVDLADLRQAGNFLRMEVIRDGIVFHVADPARLLAWEAEAISEAGEHRERIKDILEDFRATGTGYGG